MISPSQNSDHLVYKYILLITMKTEILRRDNYR